MKLKENVVWSEVQELNAGMPKKEILFPLAEQWMDSMEALIQEGKTVAEIAVATGDALLQEQTELNYDDVNTLMAIIADVWVHGDEFIKWNQDYSSKNMCDVLGVTLEELQAMSQEEIEARYLEVQELAEQELAEQLKVVEEPKKRFIVDSSKIKTLEDVITIIDVLSISVLEGTEEYNKLQHLLTEM